MNTRIKILDLFFSYDILILSVVFIASAFYLNGLSYEGINLSVTFLRSLVLGFLIGSIFSMLKFNVIQYEYYSLSFAFLSLYYISIDPFKSGDINILSIFALISSFGFILSFYHFRKERRAALS